jgi:hypothetical protein
MTRSAARSARAAHGRKGARFAVLAVLLLAACHGGAPDPAASPAPQGLEAAAITAGVIPDPASTDLTGVYATGNDRVCIVPSAKAYRIGVFVDYDETQNCGAAGVVTRDGDTLHVTLGGGGDTGCSIDARFEGDRIVFPPRVADRCQQACRGRASIAALDVTRLSASASEAATVRDARGRLLCGDGG